MIPTPDYLTWSQFLDKVKELLPLEAARKGVGDSASTLFTSLCRQAVIQLQVIDQFRVGHESIYELSDLTQEGSALSGIKPPQSAIRNCVFFKRKTDGKFVRYDVLQFPWDKHCELTGGFAAVNGNNALMAIDPQGYQFYLYPAPPAGEDWALSIKWDGKKLEFKDDELTPFTEQMALAVSYFVAARIALQVEENEGKHDRYAKLFDMEKPRLYTAGRETSQVGQ